MHFWLSLPSIKHVFIKFAKYKPIKMKRRNQKSTYFVESHLLTYFPFLLCFFTFSIYDSV